MTQYGGTRNNASSALRSPYKTDPELRVRSVVQGTVSIAVPLRTSHTTQSLPAKQRNSLKLRTIRWLLSYHKEEIDRLLASPKALLKHASVCGQLTHSQMLRIMQSLGLEPDRAFLERLFWVFDENGNGLIEPKEVMLGLEAFRTTSAQDKLELFFDICDVDGSGDIDQNEFYNLIKLCIPHAQQREELKLNIHELFCLIDEDHNGTLSRDELMRATSSSDAVRRIIEKTIGNGVSPYEATEMVVPTDAFSWVGVCAGRNNGVCHTEHKKLLNAFEEEECTYQRGALFTAENKELLKQWNEENSGGMSEEDDCRVFDEDGELILWSS